MKGISAAQVLAFKERARKGRVLTPKSERAIYSYDLGEIPAYLRNLLFHVTPHCVVQPADEEELIDIMRFCRVDGIPSIIRTTASSGFGNVLPTGGEIVIDLSLLREISGFDSTVPAVSVQTGATWSDVDAFLGERGFALQTHPSSYFSSVGGWVATGGLGINSLRFGHLRNQVTAMRVVFPNGEVRDLKPEDPWFDRFFGTEGQFGVITRIVLRVRDRPKDVFPVLLSFRADREAFGWIDSVMEKETVCDHITFMGPHLLHEVNRFYGESLIDPRPSVLAVFEDGENREQVGTGSARRAPEYQARFLWHERLFPLRLSQAGSSLLASETVFDKREAPGYIEKARRLAHRLGFDLLVEANVIGSHRLLLIPHFLAQPRRVLHYGLALALTSMLTQMAVDHGGIPYGVGIWNSPFIRDRFDDESLNALRRWKNQVDPHHLLNPSRYFGVKTRFFNVPGQVFNPLVFGILMRTLIMSSSLWAWVGQVPGAETVEPSKGLTPMVRTAFLCSRCGSCLSVCPAYRIKRDEALTARSKLRLIRRLSEDPAFFPEDARKIFLCLHCGACEQVCQSRLPLVDAWEELEKRVAGARGTPIDAINGFIKEMDESEEYRRMVDRW